MYGVYMYLECCDFHSEYMHLECCDFHTILL